MCTRVCINVLVIMDYKYSHVHERVFVFASGIMYVCNRPHACVQLCARVCFQECMHEWKHCVAVFVHVNMCVCVHAYVNTHAEIRIMHKHLCIFAQVCVHMYLLMCVHGHMYVSMCIGMYASCEYEYVCASMHIYACMCKCQCLCKCSHVLVHVCTCE